MLQNAAEHHHWTHLTLRPLSHMQTVRFISSVTFFQRKKTQIKFTSVILKFVISFSYVYIKPFTLKKKKESDKKFNGRKIEL